MKAKAQITHHADEITPKAANALGDSVLLECWLELILARILFETLKQQFC
jgi:hypothetical protein